MKIFSSDEISDKTTQEILKENDIYYSKNWESFIVTDSTFEALKLKYSFMNNEEDNDCIGHVFKSVEEYIECMYEQEYFTFFNRDYNLSRYAESIRLEFEEKVNEKEGKISLLKYKDWSDDINEMIMVCVTMTIRSDLESELIKLKSHSGDVAIIKNMINTIV